METAENKESHSGNPSLTLEFIKKVIRETKVIGKQKKRPNVVPTGAQATPQLNAFDITQFAPENHYDEVLPNVFLGDVHLSQNKDVLKRLGITHIVNTAQGKKFAQIDTDEQYYSDIGLKFYGINGAMDMAGFKISSYFRPAAEFIKGALDENGRVYVHCFQGISRSSSIVIAYLMLHEGLDLVQAVQTIRPKRAIFPNDGFLKQLIELNGELANCP